MRPVERGPCPRNERDEEVIYAHYRDARDPLISRIGDYCSYCEVALHSSIAIEHVRPKSPNPELEREWTNLLLSCDSCNSVKGRQSLTLEECFWPDRDNTARAFLYENDQPPRVASDLSPAERITAARTVELVGLDRYPGHPQFSERDRRWAKRREVWGIALREKHNLANANTPEARERILQIAVARGFWSVWMTVFQDDVDMRRSLLRWFPGTSLACFDENTESVRRVSGRS